MFAFARRPEPQQRPIGAPGISIEQYERIAGRLRANVSARSMAAIRRPSFQPAITTAGASLGPEQTTSRPGSSSPTPTMSQFRSKRLDIGGFINIRVIRDHTKRKVFEANEPERCVTSPLDLIQTTTTNPAPWTMWLLRGT